MSDLRIVVYDSGTTEAKQATDQAINHENLSFTTFYPGGLFGTCSFFVPVSFSGSTQFKQHYRIAVWSGIKMIWEGEIDGVVFTSTSTADGIQVSCTGYWGTIMRRRRWNKIWCDTRITQDKWVWQITTTGEEDKFRLDRYNRLRFTPADTEFNTDDNCEIQYELPTGQTVNRVDYNYELNEGTQSWVLTLTDVTNVAPIDILFSSGTAAMSGTPSAGCRKIGYTLTAGTAQTVDYDNAIYGQITNLKIYTEAGTISATEVVKDIRGKLSGDNVVSTDESLIGTNTQVFEPCFMEGETFAEFGTRLASFGDTSLNPWAIGLDASQKALAGDYKPVMYFEQQPDLTDYDYKLRVSEIEGGIRVEMPYHEIYNWIIIQYKDENGDNVIVTPDDDANLKDTTSIATYGQKDQFLNLGDAGVTEAKIYARRYLEWFKDPHPRMTSPIAVSGTIRTKANNEVPVCWVVAGKRILIEDYLQEIGGAGIVFIIASTRYDETSGKLTITAGSPDPLEALAARRRGL